MALFGSSRLSRARRRQLEAALTELYHQLDAHPATLEVPHLLPVDGAQPPSEGSKRLHVMSNGDRERFVFKCCPPALAMAEQTAHRLRRLGRRPSVPARLRTFRFPDGVERTGVLKPFVEIAGREQLDPDTRSWSLEQRIVMLMDHPWEWLLDNLDTNTSQYVLVGEYRLPVNIDWDRAFYSEGRSELSRFAKYKSTLPNARTFLYADFVSGRIDLPLEMLVREARRIRRLPTARVASLSRAYARVAFPESSDQQDCFVKRVCSRQRDVERVVAAFARALSRERRETLGPHPTWKAQLRVLHRTLWARWQLVLNRLLRGAIGRAARALLRAHRRLS